MRNNYIEILSEKVEIPIIQRDYAQGRTDAKTNKIRKDFLDVLFDFIDQKHSDAISKEIELDFIYGFNDQDIETNSITFIPIDGQQRLTTLWLLYWLVSVKEKIPENDKLFLSNFLYETRHSTTEFCKRLILYTPSFSAAPISNEIKNEAWYFETWDYDPSIQAMLTVLNDIETRYDELNIISLWYLISGSECPFYFYKLDMEKVGLTDDLYIKMNSRGKPLTEFEYFKAGFTEILPERRQKEKFEKSVDGKWIDAIWKIVFESGKLTEDDDIALIVDNSFLNLFNFITSVIAFKKDINRTESIRYKDTVTSEDLIKRIYSDIENQDLLFNTLDAICNQQIDEPLFWKSTFYFNKDEFQQSKTRLFYPHHEVNLLNRCLFHFAENKGISFPEQLLLYACLTHLRTNSKDFQDRIRTIRNLVINSENELRETILGYSFNEIEQYVLNGDVSVISNFNTDQIEEEKSKELFLNDSASDTEILRELEDSDIFRASISLIPLDINFQNRASEFLRVFDETSFIEDFNNKCNLLLCFGDFSQDVGTLTNLMSSRKDTIRNFLTSPGYNKGQFYTRTQKVFLDCLDYFIGNPRMSIEKKNEDNFKTYEINSKDWKFYFLKYPSFREKCILGYYQWTKEDCNYPTWKMRVKQFNGYHWDPFLHELILSGNSEKLTLEDYGAKLLITDNSTKINISSLSNGFLFESGMSNGSTNALMDDFIRNGLINNNGELIITQNADGIDLEDRIQKLRFVLKSVLNINE